MKPLPIGYRSSKDARGRRRRRWLLAGAIAAAVTTTYLWWPNRQSEFAAAPADAPNAAVRLWEVATVEALSLAMDKLAPAGGTIAIQPGTYLIDAPLEIRGKDQVNLLGTGWDTKLVCRGGDAIRLADCGFCTIRNLLLVGDRSAKSGSGIVCLGKSSSCAIEACRIVDFPESGVRFEGDATTPMSSNAVRNCHLIGNLGDQLWSAYNNDFFIVGNQFGTHRGYPRAGCVLDHSSAGTYAMNYHWNNHVALRIGSGANFNRVENNRFEECRESGLVLGNPQGGGGCAFNIIVGNTFHTNSQARSGAYPAVIAYDAREITFCTNQVFSWNRAAVQHKHSLELARNCDRWIIKDNIFRHNADTPLVYDTKATVIAKDNLMGQ